MRTPHWHVCMVRCADGSLYTDVTHDLGYGIRKLNHGEGNAYVRARLPVFLAYSEEWMNEQDARKRAARIKRMRREEKELLVADVALSGVAEAWVAASGA